jgi:dihydrofolate reductase
MSSQPLITLVVARAENGVIGNAGVIPWRLSSDMRQFKAATMGKPVLMGRKTWDSFPKKPLPGRANLVLTRDRAFRAPGAWVFSSLDALLAAGRAMAEDEVCVIGGGQLYDAVLPIADRVLLTEVALSPPGDAHFPALPLTEWVETSRAEHPASPKDDAPFVIRMLERRRQ